MDRIPGIVTLESKGVDRSLCIICQDKKSPKTIVKIPSQESVEKIYRSIVLRAENGESYYVTLQSKILSGNLSKSETVYHRVSQKYWEYNSKKKTGFK